MPRPAVDVVVPFRGSTAERQQVVARLEGLQTRPGDSLTLVDNTRGAQGQGEIVMAAGEVATPGYARNRGARAGGNEWLVFFDADALPAADLLDRLFEPMPAEGTALLAGGVEDEMVPRGGAPAARYTYLRGGTHQDDTLRFGRWGYPKTANVACRRAAFEAVGGFREGIRAGEDADLAYRLTAEGWQFERRDHALVAHRSRQTVRGLVLQRLQHGAGGAWLNRTYPGSFPPRSRPGLLWWAMRQAAGELVAAARARDRDRALWAVFEPLEVVVWELGRSLPNERPLTPAVVLRQLSRLRAGQGPRLRSARHGAR